MNNNVLMLRKKLAPIYILLLVLTFITKYVDYSLNYFIQIIFGTIITVITLFASKYIKNDNIKLIKDLLYLFLIPALIIHVYTLLLILFGKVDLMFFSSNLSKYLPIIVAVCVIYIFDESALKICFYSLIFSWTVQVVLALIFKGIGIIPFAINSGYFGDVTPIIGVSKNYLEIHDTVLSVGLLIIYFFYLKNHKTKVNFYVLSILFIIFFFGIKRIALLGVFIALLIMKVFEKLSKSTKIKLSIVLEILIFVGAFAYIYLLFQEGVLNNISNKYHINLMGRNYYYDVVTKLGKFNPFFLGTGRNSVTKILTTSYSYLKVAGVHNDILKMYIENGFFMFTFWLSISLFYIPKFLRKKYDCDVSIVYILLISYTFVIYATDNVENYFIFQLMFIIIMGNFILKKRDNNQLEIMYDAESRLIS